jgi:hypothetical protein
VCGGATTTGAFQVVSPDADTTKVLTSGGTGAIPTWQPSTGVGNWVLISSQTASSSASITFTSGITSTYKTYVIIYSNVAAATNNVNYEFQVSTNGGSSYLATGYGGYNAQANTGFASLEITTYVGMGGWAGSFANTNTGGGILWLRNIGTSLNSTADGTGSFPQSNNSNKPGLSWTASSLPTSSTINAFRFIFSSGNIATGLFTLYGILE